MSEGGIYYSPSLEGSEERESRVTHDEALDSAQLADEKKTGPLFKTVL
jgi:hypothetical protein